MSKIIGIDLGTTNSCVAVLEGGKPSVITNAEGERTTPSVVSYKNGEIKVGTVAKNEAITSSDVVRSNKRYIGTDHKFHVNGKDVTSVEVSAQILMKLKKYVSKQMFILELVR